ncbi:hypothetical protein N5C56_24270 [Pseudomonas chengduensis]|nr:zonular occludens toxin domain-containing protein [Pseudomonas chengduensis]MDH1283761.1 hypothetical protein [Pseudomonas chengduensis]
MAIKIHHGPNGSYKTSGAIQDDLVPALKAGRLIITNIRGLTRDRVFSVFPDTPSSLEIINLDLEDIDDMERMRVWWQWAPRGAFIIFDETQLIFLKSWRDADLKKFDYPGGPEQAKADSRPINWLDAWTRHRHFNWDVILTTPNITYIRDDIRSTSEKAYLHSNLAVIGVRGRYKESQHSAQDNKPPAAHTVVEIKKIKQETFKLYDSTATGSVSDTIAGKSLFKQPKVLFFLALPPILLWSALSDMGDSRLVGWSSSQPPTHVAQTPKPGTPANTVPVRSVVPDAVHDVSAFSDGPADPVDHPFAGQQFVVRGSLVNARFAVVQFGVIDVEGRELPLTNLDLAAAGYRVEMQGECVSKLTWGQTVIYALCRGRQDAGRVAQRLAQERSDSASRPAIPSVVPVTVIPDSSRQESF